METTLQRPLKSFKELAVTQPKPTSFVGEKIKMRKLLDEEIIVHDFKKEPSKFEGTRLTLQITFQGQKRIAWTSSTYLIQTIDNVKREDLPFSTKIIKGENDEYLFS